MSLPAELTMIPCSVIVADVPEGALCTAYFRAPYFLQGGADSIIVPAFTLAATANGAGLLEISLPATDDSAWAPQGWTYDVAIFVGTRRQDYTLAVPAATVGTLDLADVLNPTDAAQPGVTYLLATARGAAGGVAALDADGDVTNAAGDKITGGGGGGTPSNTVVSETSYGQSSDDGASSTYSRGDHTHGTPAAITWSTLSGKPSSFTPATHAGSHADGGSDEISIDGSQVTSGTVPFARLPTGTGSSQVAVGDHSHGGGGGGITPTFARARITTGDITPGADAAMTPLTGGPTLSIAAVAGDTLALDLNCLIDRGASAGSETYDLAIINDSNAVIRFSSTGTSSEPGSGEGDPSIYPGIRFQPAVTHWNLAVVSGDIVGGNVTFALCHKGGGAGKVFASSTFPFRWSVANFKQ